MGPTGGQVHAEPQPPLQPPCGEQEQQHQEQQDEGSQSPLQPTASASLVLAYLNGFLVAAVTTRSFLLGFNSRGEPQVQLRQEAPSTNISNSSSSAGGWTATITRHDNVTLWTYSVWAWVILAFGCTVLQHCAVRLPRQFKMVVAPVWTAGTAVVVLLFEMSSLFMPQGIIARDAINMGVV